MSASGKPKASKRGAAAAAESSHSAKKGKTSHDEDDVVFVKQEIAPPPAYAGNGASAAGASAAAAAVAVAAAADNVWSHATVTETAKMVAVKFGVTAVEAALEFQRFMELKAFVKDTDAVKISPTPLMDNMWHGCILDTRFYRQLQATLGCTIDHDPNGGKDVGKREERRQAMRVLYRMQYAADPIEKQLGAAVAPAQIPGGPFLVSIKTLTGKSMSVRVPVHATVENLQTEITKLDGIPEGQQRLLFGGQQLASGFDHEGAYKKLPKRNWLIDYGVGVDSIIHLVLRLGGC
jgi:hypothetical protein